MSTDFVSTMTGEVAFVRFGRSCGEFLTSFEFGNVANFQRTVALAEMGDTFVPMGSKLDGVPESVEDFDEMLFSGRATFGVFPVIVAAGSDEAVRFTME